jgi:site-specific DNA-methyltransferase (adenine-specific)
MPKSEVFNLDCMKGMAAMPDKAFDLAIVDVPYGLGEDGGRFRDRKGGGHRVLEKKNWDTAAPSESYFGELFRVSINQIIWGANHLISRFPIDSAGWIFWDKLMGGDFSDGELAWSSFDRPLRKFTFCNKYAGKIHPTEKPPELYKWLLQNYAKDGDTILDSHMGSQSSRIASWDLGFDYTGFEIDEDYYKAGCERFERHKVQGKLFTPEMAQVTQGTLLT